MKAPALLHRYAQSRRRRRGSFPAALLQEKDAMSGKKVGLILSGGNIDRELYLDILSEAS